MFLFQGCFSAFSHFVLLFPFQFCDTSKPTMLGSKMSSGGNWKLRVIAPLPLTGLFLGVKVE